MEVEHSKLMLGDHPRTLAFVRDISERKAYTEGLEHQALHDGAALAWKIEQTCEAGFVVNDEIVHVPPTCPARRPA
jgi:hypothetical protein